MVRAGSVICKIFVLTVSVNNNTVIVITEDVYRDHRICNNQRLVYPNLSRDIEKGNVDIGVRNNIERFFGTALIPNQANRYYEKKA